MEYWLLMAVALAGADPAPLTPSSKWIIDYQENACVLSRHFGPPPGSIELGFQPYIARDGGSLVLVLPDKGGHAFWEGKARIGLQPSGKMLTAGFTSAPVKEHRGVIMAIDQSDLSDLVAATTITVDLGRGAPVGLQTGGMTGARNGLQICQDDLVKQWGVAPADRIPESDMPNVASWFGDDAYPSDAIRSRAQGRTVAVVTIRDDGKPDACRTVASSGAKSLDKATCDIAMANARFAKVERDPKVPPRWLLLPVKWVLP